LHEFGVFDHRFGEGAEEDAELFQLVFEGGRHGYRVEHRIDRYAGQGTALGQGDAQLLVGAQQFRIDLVQALGAFPGFGRGVVVQVLVVDGRVAHAGPFRFGHGQPVPVGLEPPVEHEGGLALLRRDQADDILVQAHGQGVLLDVGDEAPPIVRVQVSLQFQVFHAFLLLMPVCVAS
jgi:hypothetical protein